MKTKIEVFEQAFSDGVGSCRAACACGKEFYQEGPYSWEKGELEGLKARGATLLEWAASFMSFEGRTFVMDCDCWKPRAQQVMGFLDGHARKIAEYFKLEKVRKTEIAQDAVEVDL